ncbi:glutamate receptor ionotropic, kainate 5-like isoform X2 [Homarus americanus]|uniref:glutamate receptor ionotropic, kainate 5-like isoform X2 n=1 Tax=Homarus americanus TaxID=6706 RepID=UPI001C43D017|nr:glutamate receptor ionotropic, kainate 5-like isoform X2 [Homarus americanus]
MAKTTLLVVPVSLLMLAIQSFYPVLSITTQTMPNTVHYLKVLEEMLQGPLAGWGVVLYLDPDLEVQVLDQLLTFPAFQDSPHVLVDLGSDVDLWSKDQPAPVLRGARVIHIVVFKEDPRPYFDTISLQWNPKYLMLFSLANKTFQNILLGNAFQRSQNLVLIERFSPRSSEMTPTARVSTSFPFSKDEKMILIGTWNSSIYSKIENIFVDRFPSFEDYKFHLATWFDDIPFLYQKENAPVGTGDGITVKMLDTIAEVLDFNYTLTVEPPDGAWGSLVNGSWTGMLGMVHRHEKNFTVSTMPLTANRIEDFDAGVWYWTEGFGLNMMTPAPLAKWQATYYPFMPSVWITIGATFAVVVLTMALQDWIQPEPFLGGFGRTWLYLLRAVVKHTLPGLPTAQWQRVLVGVWWVYCFILTTAYTANLIAFLTIPVFPKRIQTLEELAQSDYRVSMHDYGEFVPEALRSSKTPVYRTLGEKMDLVKLYDDAVYLMSNRTHALLELYSYNRIVTKSITKETTEDFMGQDYERRERLAAKEQLNNKQPLSLQHLQGVFFILLLSWAASIVVFILELVLQVLQ